MDNSEETAKKEDVQASRALSKQRGLSQLAQQRTQFQKYRRQETTTMPMPMSSAYTIQLPSDLTLERAHWASPTIIPFHGSLSDRDSALMEELRRKSCQRCLAHSVQNGNFPTCKDQNPSEATCAFWSFRDAASGHLQPLTHTAQPFDKNPSNKTSLLHLPGPASEPSTQLSAFEQENQRLRELNAAMSGEVWATPWTELRNQAGAANVDSSQTETAQTECNVQQAPS
jgi:hypothetical protein